MSKVIEALSDKDVTQIVRAFSEARARQNESFTENEAQQIVAWAQRVRMESAILNNILAGWLTVDLNKEGELLFSLTEAGSQRLQAKTLDV